MIYRFGSSSDPSVLVRMDSTLHTIELTSDSFRDRNDSRNPYFIGVNKDAHFIVNTTALGS